jgi:hypothetical protein
MCNFISSALVHALWGQSEVLAFALIFCAWLQIITLLTSLKIKEITVATGEQKFCTIKKSKRFYTPLN